MYISLVNRDGLEGEFDSAVLNGNALENGFDEWNSEVQAGIKGAAVFSKNCRDSDGALLHSGDTEDEQNYQNWKNVEHKIESLVLDFDGQRLGAKR
jgi:hypothetical protein